MRSLKSHFDPAALAAPATAAGIARTGAGLCIARLKRVKKSLLVTHAAFVPLPSEAGPGEVAAAAADCLNAWGPVECAAFGLDYTATLLRSFRFPFGGDRQIKAVLPEEFADSSPLPLQQYCLAGSAPIPGPDGNFTVHAAAANRADAAALARAFSAQGVTLRSLSPTWAALPLAWRNPGGTDRNVCFADLDHAREAYTLLGGGNVKSVLCHPPGGGGIDQLAGRIAFFLEQAGSAEMIVMAGSEADEDRMRQLEDRLGLPVKRPDTPQDIDMSAIGAAPERFAAAAALAASLLAPRQGEDINFLTGDLAPSTGIPEWQNAMRKVCAAACLVLVCLCVLEAVQGLRERSALRPLQQELFRNYREILPDVPPTTPAPQMQRIMETRLREWRMGARSGAEAERGTALGILTALHQALAPDMRVIADAVTLSRDRVTLSGTAPDFKTADHIRELLAARPLFEEVRLKSAQRGEQQRVRYEIEGKIRQTADERQR